MQVRLAVLRAHQVILGMKWNESSDLWSLGCILMELYGGDHPPGTQSTSGRSEGSGRGVPEG